MAPFSCFRWLPYWWYFTHQQNELRPWSVDISSTSHHLCGKHQPGLCMTGESIAEAARILAEFGFVLLSGGSLLSEEQMAAGLRAMRDTFSEVKAAAESQSLECLPWRYGKEEGFFKRRFYKPKDTKRKPCVFEFVEGGSHVNDGRMDQTLSATDGFYSNQPWRNHSSLLDICRLTFGKKCYHFTVGGFWNFPGSGAPHWHRDCVVCDKAYAPQFAVVLSMEDLPGNAGFPLVQPYTQSGGSYAHAKSNERPQPGEPQPVEVVMKKGEVLIWLYSTKHAASPNYSDHDRALLYYQIGVYDHEAVFKSQDQFQFLERASLPSILQGKAAQHDARLEL